VRGGKLQIEQLRGAGGRSITIKLYDGLLVRILPDRGFDLGGASYGDRQIAWLSERGEVPWRGDFEASFIGGLMFTAGLRNVGAPSEGQPKHGHYTSLSAEDVDVEPTDEGIVSRARVREGPLELERTIVVAPWAGTVAVTDVTRNLGTETEPAPLLYHCNFRWDAIEIDSDAVVPRDADAAAGDWRELGPPGPERVYEHLGARSVRVRNGPLAISLESTLPRLWQWIDPTLGVLGIEPANCSVLGRAHDRAEGRLPVLEPGEERETAVTIAVTEEEAQ
jgi:hypothetical protein